MLLTRLAPRSLCRNGTRAHGSRCSLSCVVNAAYASDCDLRKLTPYVRCTSSSSLAPRKAASALTAETPPSHLNPAPDNYSSSLFTDRCIITVEAGSGGHGCVSFLREKYIEEGPANGGDGGSGGNIYIQAIRGETSLHKLARRRSIKAGRGRNGQGKLRGGESGQDVLITVPVGTIVREIQRRDPIQDEIESQSQRRRFDTGAVKEAEEISFSREKWLVFPGMVASELNRLTFPKLPPPRKSHLAALQPKEPMWLDLDKHMETPLLLAAGAMGGIGNPHFVTPDKSRPKMATRGDPGLQLSLQFELKLLADLGLVGLPNAGKSTLLRALSNSRARVGSWAFTTLQPNVGTVVLDTHQGRPSVVKRRQDGSFRERFTVADVPGLVEDAHLDKGLGLGFLRHIERAAVLAFVIDLSTGDATQTLKALWREVAEFESQRGRELNADTERRLVPYAPLGSSAVKPDADESPRLSDLDANPEPLPFISTSPISAKPWFVAATKADLPGTRENYEALRRYLSDVYDGVQPHPANVKHAWRRDLRSVPVSAIRAEGVDEIPRLVMDLIDE